jgi:hypothetical protein
MARRLSSLRPLRSAATVPATVALVALGAALFTPRCAEYEPPPKPYIVGLQEGVLSDPTQTVVIKFTKPVKPETLRARIIRLETDVEGNLYDEDADPNTQVDVLVPFPYERKLVDEDGDEIDPDADKTISELSEDHTTLSLKPIATLPTGPRLALVIDAGLSDTEGHVVRDRQRLTFGYKFSCTATTRSANFLEGTYFMLVDVKKPLSVQVQLFAQFKMNEDGTFRAQFTNGGARRRADGVSGLFSVSDSAVRLHLPRHRLRRRPWRLGRDAGVAGRCRRRKTGRHAPGSALHRRLRQERRRDDPRLWLPGGARGLVEQQLGWAR